MKPFIFVVLCFAVASARPTQFETKSQRITRAADVNKSREKCKFGFVLDNTLKCVPTFLITIPPPHVDNFKTSQTRTTVSPSMTTIRPTTTTISTTPIAKTFPSTNATTEKSVNNIPSPMSTTTDNPKSQEGSNYTSIIIFLGLYFIMAGFLIACLFSYVNVI